MIGKAKIIVNIILACRFLYEDIATRARKNPVTDGPRDTKKGNGYPPESQDKAIRWTICRILNNDFPEIQPEIVRSQEHLKKPKDNQRVTLIQTKSMMSEKYSDGERPAVVEEPFAD